MDPILSRDSGDYPVIVRKRVDDLSKSEGFTKSRLPQFTPQEIARVRGTYDFLGINSYTTFLVSDVAEINLSEPSARKDQRIRLSQNASWPRGKSPWLKVSIYKIDIVSSIENLNYLFNFNKGCALGFKESTEMAQEPVR